MSENEARIATERRVVRTLIRTLRDAGWLVVGVFDGEDHVRWDDTVVTDRAVLETVFAVDVSWITFRNPDRRYHRVMIVLGNGEDCISDYGVSPGDVDGFGAVVDGVIDAVQAL